MKKNCLKAFKKRPVVAKGYQAQPMRAVYLLLFGLIFLLSACAREDMVNGGTDPDPEPPSGELIAVNFTVSDIGYDESEATTHPARIEEDEPVSLRAAVYLDPGTRVRIVAYQCITTPTIDTVYFGYADFEILYNDLLDPVDPPGLAVPDGNYKFVAYSFNETTAIGAFAPVTGSIPPTRDLMWGYTHASVSASSLDFHITMNHLFSKVTVDAALVNQGFYSTIDTVSGAGIAAFLPDLDVKTGALSPGSATSGLFSWIPGSAAFRISDPLYVYTDGAPSTQLEIDSIRVNGIKHDGPYNVTYSKPLESGKAYRLRLFLNYAYGGSADRITIDDTSDSPKLAITRDANDPGLYFKFGGVVGMNAVSTPYPISIQYDKLVFNPIGNPLDIIAFADYFSFYFTETEFPAVPAFSIPDWGNGIRNVSLDNYHHLANVLDGKGDPCRLIGMTENEIRGFTTDAHLYAREAELKAQGIGGWRLPTNLDNLRFSGLSSIVSPYSQHWWLGSSSPFGSPGVTGGEFPERNSKSGSPDPAKFLPASNYLTSPDGNLLILSPPEGFYWSSEAYNEYGGYCLYFHQTYADPTYSEYASGLNTTVGYTVRCVRPQNSITVSLEDWVDGVGGSTDIIVM